MPSLHAALRRLIASERARTSSRRPAPSFDRLEGRQVLSTFSATLVHDAVAVDRSFGTFNHSFQAAVTALRATATTTAAPTPTGVSAFNASVESAIGTLDTAVAADLSNLTATGASVAATIDGYTATLQGELEAAGAKLANSTNSAARALYRTTGPEIATTIRQADKAILSDTSPTSLSSSAVSTANKAVLTAFRAFYDSIHAAQKASESAGTALDPSAVSSSVATLRSSIGSAISGLGTSFTASTSNPTTAIGTELDTLSTSLTGIAAPTAGSWWSARRFEFAIGLAEVKAAFSIERSLASAISDYNHGQL